MGEEPMRKYRPLDHSHDPSEQVKRDDIKPMRYRAGRSPHFSLRIPNISRHDERVYKAYAKEQHMSVSVFFHFLCEAMEDHRLLLLPKGYTLDRIITDEMRRLANEEVEKAVLKHLGHTGEVEPYRK